jgi:cytoskeletal protein RodZ
MIRAHYRLLLALHPSAFRARFEGEMLLTFEDALGSEGGFRLLLDAVRSLLRQWLVRQRLWIYPVALFAAGFAIAFVGWARTAVMERTSVSDSSEGLLLLIAVMAIMAVLCTTVFCVVWLRLIQRLRHA